MLENVVRPAESNKMDFNPVPSNAILNKTLPSDYHTSASFHCNRPEENSSVGSSFNVRVDGHHTMNLNDNKPCNTRAAYVTVLTAKNTTSTSTEPTTSMDNKDGAIPLQSIQDAYQKPLSKPNTLGSTPSSMSTAVSTEFEPSSTTTSPISHIRKWRSGLGGSSKKQQKKRSHSSKGSSGKARAIGPISGPLPLTMPAPFVCTPLPYSDAPIIVSPTTLTNLKAATFLDMSSSPTPSKPTTSCLDLPIGSQSSNPVLSLASVNEQSAAYSDMESYRTSWKGRLFYATRDMLAPFQVEPLSHLSETESHQLPIDVSDQSVIDALHSSVQEDRDHTDDKDNEEHQTQDRRDSGEDNDATKDFALSLCQGFGSDFDLSPSNFDYQSICRDQGNDFHLQTEDNREIEKIRPRWSRTLKQIRPKSSSTISTSSDSSTESVDSINSSSSASLGKLGLSQMSSVNGISSMTTRSVPDVTSSRSSPTPSTTLKKSRAMRFSASLTNLLPISLSKDKGSTPTMPPASLPVEHEHDKSQENIDEQSSLKPTRASYMDPRAITLKRLAYIHTLKKLREREKRPFHHAVLLHMMLHQLRKAGISARQCDEIGAYYTTLEATQLSTRWDIENMAVALTAEQQQQEDTLPKQKHHQYLDAMDHTQLPQQQAQELSSLPKMNSTKKQKLRHPLVSSKNHLQSKPPNTTSDNDSDRNDASSMMGSCQHLPPQAPLSSGSVLLPATPYKMPLHPTLRMPAQPLINLDMKNTPSTTTTTPASVRKDAAMRAPTFTPPVSSDSESEDEGADGLCTEEKYDEGHDKEANEAFPSTPKVMIPKQKTNRKGILYQQQKQRQRFRQQQRMGPPSVSSAGSTDSQRHHFLVKQAQVSIGQGQVWTQAQPAGARPPFTTSAYTPMSSNRLGPMSWYPVGPSSAERQMIIATSNYWVGPQMVMGAYPYGGPFQPPLMMPSGVSSMNSTGFATGPLMAPSAPLFQTSFQNTMSLYNSPSSVMSHISSPMPYLSANAHAFSSPSYLSPSAAKVPSTSVYTGSHTLETQTSIENYRQQLQLQANTNHGISSMHSTLKHGHPSRKTKTLPSPPPSPRINPSNYSSDVKNKSRSRLSEEDVPLALL